MARIIRTSNGAIVLSLDDPNASGGSDNPLTITRTGTITGTGEFSPAIYGPASSDWTIYNRGTITSGIGVSLAGAGVVVNSAMIAGEYGVIIAGLGTVSNRGTIGGGVELGSGVVTNRTGGSIIGSNFGIEIGGSGVVTNQSTIEGGVVIGGFGVVTNRASIQGAGRRDATGIEISGGGTVTNGKAGSITSSTPGDGVEITGGAGEVINRGLISAGVGVSLADGGGVTNNVSGSIGGGVEISGGIGTVANEGAIAGGDGLDTGYGFGVDLTDGGVVTNHGTIIGSMGQFVAFSDGFGIEITGGTGTVSNHGSITGYGYGVELTDGGVVRNSAGASIAGKGFGYATPIGVAVTGGSGTIINSGTITGSTDSVLFKSDTTNDLLVIDPSAVFNGAADATGATNSTIKLATGTGTVSGIGGGQFLGFDKLVAGSGAIWTMSGANTIGTVLNNGILDVAGSLDVSSAIDPQSTGMFQLDGASSLEVAAALGKNWKMSFATGSELVIDNAAMFGKNVGTSHYAGPLLEDFAGATIDIKNFSMAGLSSHFSAATGVLQLTNSASQVATLDFQTSSLGSGQFYFQTNASGGVLITHATHPLAT